jgi:hypothetical protein
MPTRTTPVPRRILIALGLLLAGCSACGSRSATPQATPAEPAAEPGPPAIEQPADQAAAAGSFQAHMLLGESPQALHTWTTAAPAERASQPGMLSQVDPGQRVFVRVAVTGFEAQPPFSIEGSMRLRGPDGRLLHEQAISADDDHIDEEAPGVLVLLPGMDMVFDPGDTLGAYMLEAEISSAGQSLDTQAELRLSGGGLQLDPAMAL